MLRFFDALLLLVIVLLAWRSLNDRDLFRGVIKFIALGLLLAVAWVRLRAPDVALAEAAVGSGLTGALLLAALVRMRRRAGTVAPALSRADRGEGRAPGAEGRGPSVKGRGLAASGSRPSTLDSRRPTSYPGAGEVAE